MVADVMGFEQDALARLRARLVDVGMTVGAYRLLHPIGRGGNGEVWLAHDPRLDRRIAIKLLQPHVCGDPARVRLLREARAIAQIVHPNVVAIYDSGTIDGDTRSFIAMEYVDGCSLAAWLRDVPRSADEIIAMFVAAGQGLDAAHRAGQIHRDFKPSNVMIGPRGEVKVLDFGLALGVGESRSRDTDPAAQASSGDDRLTETGVVMGTPRYMSPEQHTGDAVTPASDQFSFCCALLEALQHAPAFVGCGAVQLCRAKLRGDIASGTQDVAPHVRAVLERGLDPRPERRFRSMAALLEQLGARRGDRRGRFATIAVLAVLALVGATEPADASSSVRAAVDAFDEARLHARIELGAGRALLEHGAPEAAPRLEHALALAETSDDELLSAQAAAALVMAAVRQPA
ncbi:MAG TPA: serine/threonine-protein kinase, partial [Nannocystaceae bacterium]|nr:serine/threonine-protein kinase [Nannocystaceae bacterium]